MADLATKCSNEVRAMIAGKSPGAATQAIYSSIDDGALAYTRNPALFAAAVDLSCLSSSNTGRSPSQDGGILLSPSVMVVANHFGSAKGASYTFTSPANASYTRTVIAEWNPYNSDILLARFSSPLPAAIKPAPVFAANLLQKLPIPVFDPSTGTYARVDSPLIVFTEQFRNLYIAGLKNPVWGASGTDVQEYSSSPADATLAAWWEHLVGFDSGCGFGMILNGLFVALGVWKSGGSAPSWEASGSSLVIHGRQIAAKIAEWNLSESLSVINLSGYPTVPNASVTPTPGVDMSRTYKVYADGTGDFTTLAAAFNAAETNADVGAVIFEYQGAVGDLAMFNLFPNATSITVQPKAGYGATGVNNSLASMGAVSWTFDDGDSYNLILSGQMIGVASFAISGGYAGSITLKNLRHRIITNLGTGARSAMSVASGGAGNLVLNIANFISSFEIAQTGSNVRNIFLNPTGTNWQVNLYDTTIDGQKTTGLSGGCLVIASDASASTVTLDARNTAFLTTAGTSVRQLGGGVGTLTYAATCAGNRSTDANASLGTTSGLAVTDFAGADTFNYNLSPTSVGIAGGTPTSPVSTDITGSPRPRPGATYVDVGAVNLASSTQVGSIRPQLHSWLGF